LFKNQNKKIPLSVLIFSSAISDIWSESLCQKGRTLLVIVKLVDKYIKNI